jgi:hypothetical protein
MFIRRATLHKKYSEADYSPWHNPAVGSAKPGG